MSAMGKTHQLGGEPSLHCHAQIGREGTAALVDGEWGVVELSTEGLGPASGLRSSPSAVLVMGIAPHENAIAAALVPQELAGKMRHNGVPALAGLLLLRHADQLELGDHRLWLSGDRAAIETPYDPVEHGEGRRCARTKVVMQKGDLVTECPGTPEHPNCGLLYRSDVFAGMRCHGCGCDPSRPAWEPPQTTEKSDFHDYLDGILHG